MEEVQLWFCYGNEIEMLVRIPRQLLGSFTKCAQAVLQTRGVHAHKTRLLSLRPYLLFMSCFKSNAFQSKQHMTSTSKE